MNWAASELFSNLIKALPNIGGEPNIINLMRVNRIVQLNVLCLIGIV